MFKIEEIIRPSLLNLKAYSSARDEFEGTAEVYLDANENPTGEFNRYPDPLQKDLKLLVGSWNELSPDQIFIGNGSDEIIDLLIRLVAVPGKDQIGIFTPTYGMYKVSAQINDVEVVELPLDQDFQPILPLDNAFWENERLKIIFLCSPNNPIGNDLSSERIETILKRFKGLVVMDEAYVHFSEADSWSKRLSEYSNLIVLQTFSKAFGLASLRVGLSFASPEIVAWLNKIKPPYNVNALSQKRVINKLLEGKDNFRQSLNAIINQRTKLEKSFSRQPYCRMIAKSSANFLLFEFVKGAELYSYLKSKGIVVRRRQEIGENVLRITVGSAKENEVLMNEIASFYR